MMRPQAVPSSCCVVVGPRRTARHHGVRDVARLGARALVTKDVESVTDSSVAPKDVADRLLCLMVVTKAPVSDYSLDALAELGDKPTPTRTNLYV